MGSRNDIEEIISPLCGHLCQYSFEECARSVLLSNLWLPNAACPIRHRFISTVIASIPADKYAVSGSIHLYEDFRLFHEPLCAMQLPISSVEDYVPELDWGEVKYHLDGTNYSIFYGCEIENIYDYLQLFEMIHLTFDEEYCSALGRLPKQELLHCLALQDSIIKAIPFQPKDKQGISPGHIETPPEAFWQAANSALQKYTPTHTVPPDFVARYSLQVGSAQSSLTNWQAFIDALYENTGLQSFFISDGQKHMPLLPRNYSAVLFNAWGKLLLANYDAIHSDRKKLSVMMSACLARYVGGRLGQTSVHSLANIVTPGDEHHKCLFSHVFVSKERLVLAHLLDPVRSAECVDEQLAGLASTYFEARELMSTRPIRFNLNLDRIGIEMRYGDSKIMPPVEILALVPLPTIVPLPISVGRGYPARVMFLEHFLAVVDEMEHADEFSDFLDYWDGLRDRATPMVGVLDIFASYKDSHGVLEEGARDYDYIALDPHWGSAYRYESLRDFWRAAPPVAFFGHPRTWKIAAERTGRLRLSSKSFMGAAFYQRVGRQQVFIASPFDKMGIAQAKLASFMMECLEDHLSGSEATLCTHAFFSSFGRLNILLFPLSLVQGNQKAFEHLAHMRDTTDIWAADSAVIGPGEVGMRIVFNDEKIISRFSDSMDQTPEIELLVSVVTELDKRHQDASVASIVENLRRSSKRPPRFGIRQARKLAAFPEAVATYAPNPTHFKMARKAIATLAAGIALEPGTYGAAEAEAKINSIRDALIRNVNSEISRYEFSQSIPFLIARTDALTAEDEQSSMCMRGSVDREVDFKPETLLAERHSTFRRSHRNCRYLIEKFVQIQPHGVGAIGSEAFQYLCALVDWLHVFYDASDALHYSIEPASLAVNSDFLVEIQYGQDIAAKQKEFAEELGKLQLGIIGNASDVVNSPRPVVEYMDLLDQSFRKGLGFRLRTIGSLLNLFSQWPYYVGEKEERTSYSADFEQIKQVALKEVQGLQIEELRKAMDFLALRQENMLSVIGQPRPADDLPVWEHRKRHSSYQTRPIIQIGPRYLWGAFAVRDTAQIWLGVSSGTLPFDVRDMNIENTVRTEKQLIERALVEKAYEIMRRFTQYAEKDCYLHKRDADAGHPDDLGDYDVIAFLPSKNTVISIECKHNGPVFCPKDSKRLREAIFGGADGSDCHLRHVNRRHAYLRTKARDVFGTLDWPYDPSNPPAVVSVYVTRRLFWWMRRPPRDVEVSFVRVDMLSHLADEIGRS